jgi:hypothetical protein
MSVPEKTVGREKQQAQIVKQASQNADVTRVH